MRLACLAALMVFAAPATAAEPAAMPEWMAGEWSGGAGDVWLEEFWTSARGGIMLGAARVGTGENLAIWETTRILRKDDGTLSFYAQPRGVPGAEFPLVRQDAGMVEFANAAHDYPQRVRYWREGERLLAEISLIDGSKPERFEYVRMRH